MQFTWQYNHQTPRKLRSALKMSGVTSTLMKVAIYHGGKMLINGQEKWAIDMVHYGDTYSLVLPPEVANDQVDESTAPINIAYEDRDFLVLNKPAGVATVPAHNVPVADSLVNRVKYYYHHQGYENQVTHVATRLDKDTSGLVVFPKHRFAHAVLDRQLKRYEVKKNYLALVSGRLQTSHGYVDAPIRRDPESFVKREVAPGGKASVTFRRATPADAFATARGILKSKALEGDSVRLSYDVWIETETGEKVIVGTASAIVPA